jgi:hypothetical protein
MNMNMYLPLHEINLPQVSRGPYFSSHSFVNGFNEGEQKVEEYGGLN